MHFHEVRQLAITRIAHTKTQDGHDKRKYLDSLTRLAQCVKCTFQSYQYIQIILEHIRRAFNII
jgi:hypothetical protein